MFDDSATAIIFSLLSIKTFHCQITQFYLDQKCGKKNLKKEKKIKFREPHFSFVAGILFQRLLIWQRVIG